MAEEEKAGPRDGDHVRITNGDYSGRTGFLEIEDDSIFGPYKRVQLDGEPIGDPMYPPVTVDSVELIAFRTGSSKEGQ